MTTSCMQAIKQQLEDMPLEEFEDLLKGVTAVNKDHEGMPQHAELLSQLKHHVKVPPDEPIQTKASEKDCRTFMRSLNLREKVQRVSNSSSSSTGLNLNGNVSTGGNHNSYVQHKHASLFVSSTCSSRCLSGDQNANPLPSSESPSSSFHHQQAQSNFTNYNNAMLHLGSANAYNLDGGGDDDEMDGMELDDPPSHYIGSLPAQYVLPTETKLNKDLPVHVFPKQPLSSLSCGTSSAIAGSSLSTDNPVSTPSSSWDLQSTRSSLQLNDGYKSVSSVTSGVPAYMGRSASASEPTFGTVRSVSPTLPPLPPSAIISKSPSLEGSQFDKPSTRRAGDRKSKSAKKMLRENLFKSEEMPGYKGREDDIEKLLEFVEGTQNKPQTKKPPKDKKKDPKSKGNEKQLLSKAASLDENSLGYGSKKSEDRSRTSKDIEKKNSANITKSSTAICSVDLDDSSKPNADTDNTMELPRKSIEAEVLVNGTVVIEPNLLSKSVGVKASSHSSGKPALTTKSQFVTEKEENLQSPEVVPSVKSDSVEVVETKPPSPPVEVASVKLEDEKLSKPDESDGPYVLVQSKKKREKKKGQQREAENFSRSHADQSRREGGRTRRGNAERRKSVGSVPGSENSECSDDDDSVRSLPAGECTPRERIPKPCSSSGGTPQTSYADIARMSRDENSKTPQTNSAISLLPNPAKSPIAAKSSPQPVIATAPVVVPVAVTSDSNFPALSPQNIEKTVPVGAAIWPCRQRLDYEVKEKSPTSCKSDDAPKECAPTPPAVSPPQTTSANSNPPPCSSKVLFETKDVGLQQEKASVENPTKDTPSSPITTSPANSAKEAVEKEPLQIKCNGDVTPSNSVDIDSLNHANGVKALGQRRTEEKKAKDKSTKVSDEITTKATSWKGAENGESIIHSNEAVVFCGGKFDSSNLPAGQKIGFEFGFGVIEALNDNSGLNESSLAITSSEFPPIVPSVQPKQARPRSQDRMATRNQQNKLGDKSTKKDLAEKPVEKQVNKVNGPTKTQITFNPLGDLAFDFPALGQGPPKRGPQTSPGDTKRVTPPVAETPQLPCPPLRAENPPQMPTDTRENNSLAEIGVAQLYQRPKSCNAPANTIDVLAGYMDKYCTKVFGLTDQGKLSIQRV